MLFLRESCIALLIYIGKRSPTADAIGLPFILAQSLRLHVCLETFSVADSKFKLHDVGLNTSSGASKRSFLLCRCHGTVMQNAVARLFSLRHKRFFLCLRLSLCQLSAIVFALRPFHRSVVAPGGRVIELELRDSRCSIVGRLWRRCGQHLRNLHLCNARPNHVDLLRRCF